MNVDLNYAVFGSDLPEAVFTREIVSRGFNAVVNRSWRTSSEGIAEPDGWSLTLHQRDDKNEWALFEAGSCLVHVELFLDTIGIGVAGPRDSVDEVVAYLEKVYPKVELDQQQVEYRFWFSSPHGKASRRRTLDVPAWSSIRRNYPARCAAGLQSMFDSGAPRAGGGLALWHGEPGTGKTFALRALSWAWREWSDFEYVLDPEGFFGDANYMLDVLLYEDRDAKEHRWRTLVIEDTGELVAVDGNAGAGSGLSRLLNVADGLIGQGLRVQFLLTTNEALTSLHPAVLRPGRCSHLIEFTPFAPDEAESWARRNEIVLPARRSYKLAELFALRDGHEIETERPRLGFIA